MLTLIDDVLDMSRIEAGRSRLAREPFSLEETVGQARAMLAPLASAKGLALTAVVAPEVPAVLVGDPVRLRQVLVNLLGNAVKFTDQGEITLTVSPRSCPGAPGGEAVLLFTVRDTGTGVAEGEREAIFERFVQGEAAGPGKGGAGLGLAVAREIVELMHGSLGVEDAPKGGASFFFTARFGLPACDVRMEPAVAFAAEPVSLPPLRILHVEDEEPNRNLLRLFLEGTSLAVDEAETGRQALELFASGRYDLVFLDMRLPDMEGAEVARAMRAGEKETGAAGTPIVAISANAFPSDVAACLEAGCDEHLAKPVGRDMLLRAVARHVASGGAGGGGRAAGSLSPLFESLAPRLLKRFKELTGEAEAAFEGDDFQTMKRSAHALKGLGMNFGLDSLARLGGELEACGENGSREEAARVLKELNRLVEGLRLTSDRSSSPA